MKPALFVHIGHSKTGSTTIQRSLMAGVDVLRDAGLLLSDEMMRFPLTGPVAGHPLDYFRRLNAVLPPEQAREEFGAALTSLRGQLQTSGARGAIISSENLSIPQAAALFGAAANDFEIRVAYYVRRHDEWLESGWKQWGIKNGASLEEYVRNRLAAGEPGYLARARAWREVAAELRVIPVEQVDDLEADFWDWIGVRLPDAARQPAHNRTLDWSLLDLLARNPQLFHDKTDNRVFNLLDRLLPEHAPRVGHGLMGAELRREVIESVREQSEELRREFFPAKRSMNEWMEDVHVQPETPPAWGSVESVQRAMGQMLGIFETLDQRIARQGAACESETASLRVQIARQQEALDLLNVACGELRQRCVKQGKDIISLKEKMSSKIHRLERELDKTWSFRWRRFWRRLRGRQPG
jgi:hypothetical protein